MYPLSRAKADVGAAAVCAAVWDWQVRICSAGNRRTFGAFVWWAQGGNVFAVSVT